MKVYKSLYKKKYHVGLSDVDFKKKLKLSALFDYFQDLASVAADELGYGINQLGNQYNVIWVLIRMRVDIERMPAWDEDIIIETWPRKPKTIEFGRDFIVRDHSGKIIAKAISSWVLLDMDSRQIQKSKRFNIDYPDLFEEKAIDCRLKKLNATEKMRISYEKVISYSDIDVNGHVNNTKYIEYVMDSFSYEEHKSYTVCSIQVNFINEALPGDTLLLCKSNADQDEGCVYIEGIGKKDEETVFSSKLLFKKIKE
ncbi:acyl-[acyl-carrier-protein] thioesterase [Haloplasma contractile]|uniref:Oleoyl-acyl-carrier-protein hydrolase n=1 Tax=Haloplasma contractile SSD-17B TaxID=1033810 RepID=F7Q2G6_9MOLU|nr:acyl-ACP thioesterase domain-containing protein [Haloplasma contractile]ERJ11968.1 oleoyl-acyl-carrier-protein hydrolase [Haloplasma contractile SSD-17B]